MGYTWLVYLRWWETGSIVVFQLGCDGGAGAAVVVGAGGTTVAAISRGLGNSSSTCSLAPRVAIPTEV